MSAETIAMVGHITDASPNRPSIDQYEAQLRGDGSPWGRVKRMARWLIGQPREQGLVTPAVSESLAKARDVRRRHDVVFYLAGALTGVSEETKQRYTNVSETIARHDTPGARMFGYAPHLHGTDPVKHPNVTPKEVRTIDYLWAVVVPDAHLNFMEPIAHGNAIEAGWAEEHGIPSVHIVPEGMTTSRLVRGMENIAGTITYEQFNQDGMQQVGELLNGLQAERLG